MKEEEGNKSLRNVPISCWHKEGGRVCSRGPETGWPRTNSLVATPVDPGLKQTENKNPRKTHFRGDQGASVLSL